MSDSTFTVCSTAKHFIGNDMCYECSEGGYPWPCGCGGLVHSEFDTDNYSDEMGILYAYECDRCGASQFK